MQGMSTRLRGRFGTSGSILEVNATLCPPGTLAPFSEYDRYQISNGLMIFLLCLSHLARPIAQAILSP